MWCLPTFAKALVSFGKQDPPYAGPALKNLEPILLSSPIPRATSSTLTWTFSHKFAISFIKLILVAKKALDAYFISSAALLEEETKAAPLLTIGRYNSLNIFITFLSLAPITTRSGYLKSFIASPSLRNSGLDTIVNNPFFLFLFKIFSILSPVPMGTVDFVTIILWVLIFFEINWATENTWLRSAETPSFAVGVPTAIKTISDLLIEPIKSSEKLSLPASKFFLTNSDKPGSNIGISPFTSLLNFSLSLSIQITLLPRSEKQTPDTKPT